jgi:type IV pilus assembly protein PilF
MARTSTLVLAAWLAGCATTTTTTTTGPISEVRSAPAPQADDSGSDPNRRAQVRMELAAAYFANNQADVALVEVNKAIAASPNLGAAYNLRGLVHAALGKDDLAEADFRRALSIDPRDGEALQNYGWYLCQHKRYDEGNAQFNQVLSLPQRRDVARTLLAQGVCHAFAGRLEEAEKALQRSYQVDPNNPSTSVNLAEVLLRRGEFDRARFHIRRVNGNVNFVSAQTLWLATRIEQKMGNVSGAQELGRQLQSRFPETREAIAFQRGQFDE